jgi:hypothetical protein
MHLDLDGMRYTHELVRFAVSLAECHQGSG